MEPHLPAPRPVGRRHDPDRRSARRARRRRRLAGDRCSTRSRRRRRSRARPSSTDTALHGLEPDARPYVVVATQGVWDEEALASALRREASYVGLVASPTRVGGGSRRGSGRRRRSADERLAALRAPAGLDLGAETAEEIALSILAELVQVRRGRAAVRRRRPDRRPSPQASPRHPTKAPPWTTSCCSTRSAG